MITCRDVANLQLDGTELLTGEVGLERVVSWTYMVQTKPYADHMNPGNFALIVVDYLRFDMKDAFDAMIELNELGISGLAISVVDDKEMIPDAMIQKALALKLPLTKKPMYMRFLNKFVLLFEETKDKETEHQIENILHMLDNRVPFAGLINSTCILGSVYTKPADFGKSYQEAKNLIPKKDLLPNPTGKKVLSASSMGVYRFLFNSQNHQEILDYCNAKLKKLEMYDNTNSSFLIDTLLNYYMCGFNIGKAAQMMYVHRNSLQYRLKKIEEILEISLDDSMAYLDLVNCILIKRLMFQ